MSYYETFGSKIYRHISLDELHKLIVNSIGRTGPVEIDVREATGYVLYMDVKAKYSRPLYSISHVDGFAVSSTDTHNASNENPVKLKIIDGDPRKGLEIELRSGEAFFVETGYPIPINSDAVIPIEETKIIEGYVYVYKPVSKGYHVFPSETDFKRDELVFKAGRRLSIFDIKTLMDLGVWSVKVYGKPRIAVFSIGDELVDEPYPGGTYIPASTRYVDKYCLEYYNGEVVHMGILPDDPETIVNVIENYLDKTDIVITIGGVSMGPRDHTWISLFKTLKPDKWWRGVKFWPGRSNSGMIVRGKPIVNQPGLPQSSISTLLFILTPLVRYMQGEALKLDYPYKLARVDKEYVFEKYVDHHRIYYTYTLDEEAVIIENPGSYYLKPLINSNGFIILNPYMTRLEKNQTISVYRYPPIHGLF